MTPDIDWQRSRLHVQRTITGRLRFAPPKDHARRWVVMSPALRTALREHVDNMRLEGSVNSWTPEQEMLVFPNVNGRIVQYMNFTRGVWKPLLKKVGLTYRLYQSTRHSFASWLLETGTDIRWVQAQLGHSTIQMTVDVYGHLQPEKHEHAVAALDQIVRGDLTRRS